MLRRICAFLFIVFMAAPSWAQQTAWIQIEAQRTLTGAQNAARGYAAAGVDDVNGFALPSGWYGIALGPYSEADATALLRQLRSRGLIPNDAYLVDGRQFRQQYWPVGVSGAATAAAVAAPDTASDTTADTDTDTAVALEQIVVPEPDPIQIPDQTIGEARAAEQALGRDEKQELQRMLQWAGVYSGAIDGLFGRGTRNSMGAWQEANNHEVTGVLTTGQRAELLAAYNAILEGMNLQLVRDDAAGIEMRIPTGVVAFSKYDPPFVRFDPKGELQAQVLFISQPGDAARMAGLYEIMQTLEIVPPEGARQRNNSSFEIEGIGASIHSYTYVTQDAGEIKGFTLVWPTGDEERRTRILNAMKASFTPINGVLDPAIAAPDDDQAIDLVAGLRVRRPLRDRSGFYVSASGDVLTSAEAVDGCGSITLGKTHEATVLHRDDALGLAVLRPSDAIAPPMVAEFQTGIPRIQAEIAVAGFPYGGILATPALTFGKLADIRGLNGEEEVKRLSIFAQEGDAGGPVFDNGGAVLGMLLPKEAVNGQVLPPEVSFSVDADQIVTSLQNAGVAVQTTDTVAYMTPEALTLMAADVTVLVSCWED